MSGVEHSSLMALLGQIKLDQPFRGGLDLRTSPAHAGARWKGKCPCDAVAIVLCLLL